ncbi:ABC transporter ATP-binding protein, partial [Patescibacteria group bacterium]|nr:ABC transporter ATP-binding protein [Patescibacteria group bacterium]
MKLSVKLNQNYKSFPQGFKTDFEGDLIIFSGVNGSGKTQFLEIINGRPFYDKNTAIDSNVLLDGIPVSNFEISYRSFKENISIPEFSGSLPISNSRNQVWNNYNSHRLNENVNELYDFRKSVLEAKELLIKEFGQENFDSGRITQDDINKSKKFSNFIWKNDDIFTNFISNTFFTYAWKSLFLSMGKGAEFQVENIAPWEKLNNLFEELNFEYRFKSNYQIDPNTSGLDENPTLYEIDR